MKLPHNAHVAVADGNRFMFLKNTGQIFEPKLEMVEQPDLDPSNFSAGVRHQDDVSQRTGATDLNELAHGAAVAEWLNAKALVGEIDKTVTGEPLDKIAKIIADT